jgi:hypothetical protein
VTTEVAAALTPLLVGAAAAVALLLVVVADNSSDAAKLARDTLIPRKVWKAGFVVLALFCVWQGFLLLAP